MIVLDAYAVLAFLKGEPKERRKMTNEVYCSFQIQILARAGNLKFKF